MILPKLIVTDIDGVWTDGGMYYGSKGEEYKKFNTSDSAGVLFSKLNNIDVAIITGENSEAVINRAKKLDIEYVFTGIKNKKKTLIELCDKLSVTPQEVCYIGDDINDIIVFNFVGFSACPQDARDYIKEYCNLVLSKNGGTGVFREFVEYILNYHKLMPKTLKKYLDSIK